MTEPDHTCTPPDGDGAKVTFYTCSCGRTWLLHRAEDGPDEWRLVAPDE